MAKGAGIPRPRSESRQIGFGRRAMTGCLQVKNAQIEYESALERDFLILSDIDPEIVSVLGQPVTLDWTDEDGRRRRYTPDFLVAKLDGTGALHEIKYRADLKADWRAFRPRFEAARAYARSQGHGFRITTDKGIRTARLRNAIAIRRCRHTQPSQDVVDKVVSFLVERGPTPIRSLLQIASTSASDLSATQTVWSLLAQGILRTDLSMPITADSVVWTMPVAP